MHELAGFSSFSFLLSPFFCQIALTRWCHIVKTKKYSFVGEHLSHDQFMIKCVPTRIHFVTASASEGCPGNRLKLQHVSKTTSIFLEVHCHNSSVEDNVSDYFTKVQVNKESSCSNAKWKACSLSSEQCARASALYSFQSCGSSCACITSEL